MRSTASSALGLSLLGFTQARVANTPAELQQRDGTIDSQNSVVRLFNRLFKKAPAATCYQDNYYNFIQDPNFDGAAFCRSYVDYSNTTIVVTTTPGVSTFYDTYTTEWLTERRVTTVPAGTATITARPGIAARDAVAQPVPASQGFSDEELDKALQSFRRVANVANVSDAAVLASFSSACACQNFAGPTVTSTSTAVAKIVTISAFDQETTTIFSTSTAGTVTKTVTADSMSTTSSEVESTTASPVSAPGPSPTSPGFQCPEDNGIIVRQLIGPEKFDYLVQCDTEITDPDFWAVRSYSSYSQCAAACSLANQRLDLPVCQGFSFTPSNQSLNCFLKGSANSTVPAAGVDSGILQSIAVAVANVPTNTSAQPSPAAMDSEEISSSMSELFPGSSTSISVVTPLAQMPISGRGVMAVTSYSTFISDGSTYSSGTVFSTYYTSNGMWYYSYFTAWTQSWASATTVYASSETGNAVSNSSSSGTTVEASGADGTYTQTTTTNTTSYNDQGYNVTQVIANNTFAANGTEISSLAVTTTLYWSYATGGAGSSGSGFIASNSAGIITSSAWSSLLSTQVVVFSGEAAGGNGGGSGGQGSGVVQTPAPSIITNGGNTAFSSGFAASGFVSGAAGASSTAASGLLSNSTSPGPNFTPISATSGQTGIGGASSTEASSSLPTSHAASFSPVSSNSGQTGIAGASSTFASGLIPSSGIPLSPVSSTSGQIGIEGASSTFGSGPTTSSDTPLTPVPSTSGESSTGGVSTTEASASIPTSHTPFTPISSDSGASGTAYASSTGASSGSPFSDVNDNRSGTLRTSSRTVASGSIPSSALADVSSTTPAPTLSVTTETTSAGTGSVLFSAPSGPRSRSSSLGNNSTAPVLTSRTTTTPRRTLTESVPVETDSVPFSAPGAPRSGTNSLSGNSTTARVTKPSTTAPPRTYTETLSSDTRSIPPPPFTNSLDSRAGTRAPSSTLIGTGSTPVSVSAPSGTAPSLRSPPAPTGSVPFSTPGGSRSGFLPPPGTAPFSSRPFSTGTRSSSSGTAPLSFPPFPTTSGSTCVTQILGTTTIFTTITEYGCYSNCPPNGYGGYGGWGGGSASTWGPPAQATRGGK